MKIFTIGVYKSTESQFFKKLTDNNIDTLCDIRQRRGVRGSEYTFANSNYLQQKLVDMDIKYGHIIALAPTTEIREKQKIEDARLGDNKRDRNKLGKVFTDEYKSQILSRFDFDKLIEQLDNCGASNVVFLCVEQRAEACHRSLVAEEIHKRYGYEVINL
ncbi:MAG: DUF488 domain-containing protein [Bacteroidales bacterium]|jgi:uncharacterized protein (DUF488 family)|nr:DUF488 domain-containing protein [Bacteroidales bacterium]